AVVVRHANDGRLAPTRVAFQRDATGIHGLIGLEVIQGAAGTPGPGAQDTPIVELARLALVDQADDALVQTGAVVGLNAAGVEDGVAPALGQNLLLPGGTRGCRRERPTRTAPAGGEAAEAELHDHRHRAC